MLTYRDNDRPKITLDRDEFEPETWADLLNQLKSRFQYPATVKSITLEVSALTGYDLGARATGKD